MTHSRRSVLAAGILSFVAGTWIGVAASDGVWKTRQFQAAIVAVGIMLLIFGIVFIALALLPRRQKQVPRRW